MTEFDTGYCQQMANRSYLKSQKLKEISEDRKKMQLLKKENESLKKEKMSLEHNV